MGAEMVQSVYMSPPYFDPAANGWLVVDSDAATIAVKPLQYPSPAHVPMSHGVSANHVDRSLPNGAQANLRAPPVDRRPIHHDTGSGLRFFVVDHPDKLRDREQMRQNRKHVMQDYLVKERLKPSSTDLRAVGSIHERKRKKSESLLSKSVPDGPIMATPLSSEKCAHTSLSYLATKPELSRNDVDCLSKKRPASSERSSSLGELQLSRRKSSVPTAYGAISPLVAGSRIGDLPSDYLKVNPNEVPFPLHRFGGGLNPFGTMPSFPDSAVNVPALKLKCSQRFGSKGLRDHWMPTALGFRHSFLSTLCISSFYDDIMSRSTRPAHMRTHESFERLRVRVLAIEMINESVKDPDLQTADTTIMAVLHLLNAEIMGCNDKSMQIHQTGLHNMVRQRGGLRALGVNGHLASMLTITMYMTAVLRETTPHADFQLYAQGRSNRPPEDMRSLPESPVYCRPTGFVSVQKAISPSTKTYQLLDDVRRLTNAFFLLHGTSSGTVPSITDTDCKIRDNSQQNISALKAKAFLWHAAELYDFPTMSSRYEFEAIRLTSLVYSFALDSEIPFSAAAALLTRTALSPGSTHHSSQSGATPETSSDEPSFAIRIKKALMRSDMTDCWGHMAGVLFWITLVAGATAKAGASEVYTERRETGDDEEEEARIWLAAVAVRCSILLSFEYGGAILETLKRMVGIQQTLACSTTESYGSEVGSVTGTRYGPQEPQKGFGDFVQDFLDE